MAKTLPIPAAANKLVGYLLSRGISGVPPLSSAQDLATEYLIDQSYVDNDERVDSLINWETTKNFTSGFISGLGGIVTLPISIPAALGASWLIQARMAGAIARIYGHKLTDDRVRTMILLCLAGDAAKEAVKSTGINLGQKLTERAIAQIPGRALIEINKLIGFRLLTKAGERGVVNFSKAVPLVGGVVGGAFDGVVCRMVGRTAKGLFKRA
jgi:EcsC family protein